AKLIVTGASRQEALERSRRALAEFVVDGMPTILPFHRAVTSDPAFTDEPFRVHTRWIETEFVNELAPCDGGADGDAEPAERERITVEVGGRRLEVVVPGGFALSGGGGGGGGGARRKAPTSKSRAGAAANVTGDTLTAPMQGTI